MIDSAGVHNRKDHAHARVLNGLLVFLMLLGGADVILAMISSRAVNIAIIIMIAGLGVAYYLNRHRNRLGESIYILIAVFSGSALWTAYLRFSAGEFSILYFLVISILLAEFFLPFRAYLLITGGILAVTLLVSLPHPAAMQIFWFLLAFNLIIAFFAYNRQGIEQSKITRAIEFSHEKQLLAIEKRRSAQLGLLQETGQRIFNSLVEQEILQYTLDVLVNRFGYAEVAISMLGADGKLEVTAITGTQDFGYRPGFKQDPGDGIIGQTALQRKLYCSQNVAEDPYYFSTEKREGSAAGIPIMTEESLLGVLYVESAVKNYFKDDDLKTLQTLCNYLAASLEKARLHTSTREQLRIISTVKFISDVIASSLDLNEILSKTVGTLKQTLGYTFVSIYLLEGEYLQLGAQVGYPEDTAIHKIHRSQGISGRTIQLKKPQFIRDVNREEAFLRAYDQIKSEICIPLLKENNVLGVLNVESASQGNLTDADLELLTLLAGPIALAIDNAKLHEEVKTAAITDTVSGLLNRYEFERLLLSEVQRAERYKSPLSLLIVDVDSFKKYNDTFGHPAGDERLKTTAALIRSHLRNNDVAARYGGDEFAIILPNTSKQGAIQFAKRLHRAAEISSAGQALKDDEDNSIPGYTLSIGIATFPEDGATLSSLLVAADHAEIHAKQTGKNKIFIAGEQAQEI